MPTAPVSRASTAKRTNDASLPTISPIARSAVFLAARAPAAWAASGCAEPSDTAALQQLARAAPCSARRGAHRPPGHGLEQRLVQLPQLEDEATAAILACDHRALHLIARPGAAAMAGHGGFEAHLGCGRDRVRPVGAEGVGERADGPAGELLECRARVGHLAHAPGTVELRQVGMG